MSLSKILQSRDRQHGFPLLKIFVIAERSTQKVIAWDHTMSPPCPIQNMTKTNKIISFSNGEEVTRTTIYEELSQKLKEGNFYCLRNYGVYNNRINIKSNTQIFRAAPFNVPPSHLTTGRDQVHPQETKLEYGDEPDSGLYSVSGKIAHLWGAKWEKKAQTPIREMLIDHGGRRLKITLWRESTMLPLECGQYVTLHHLIPVKRGSNDQLKFELRSTTMTTVTEITGTERELQILGTTEEPNEDQDWLVVSTADEVFRVSVAIWKHHDETDFSIQATVLEERIIKYIIMEKQVMGEENVELGQGGHEDEALLEEMEAWEKDQN